MEKDFEEREKLIKSLIQNTPFVDDLILAVAKISDETRRSLLDVVGGGRLRHQKCRRFYDWLLNEYSQTQIFKSFDHQQTMWKIFHNSGNSAAWETIQLMTTKSVHKFKDLKSQTSRRSTTPTHKATPLGDLEKKSQYFNHVVADSLDIDDPTPSQFNFVVACRAARVGDAENLKSQLKCCGSNDLRPITELDWSSKTLLHNTVDQGLRHTNQLLCIDLLSEFASRHKMKNKFFDAQDSLNGETALHLAIKGESVVLCRKLLAEGADLLIRNKNGKNCLDLFYEKLPQVVEFLLDGTIAVNGDITGDLFYLSIDFSVIVGYEESSVENMGNYKKALPNFSRQHQSSDDSCEAIALNTLPVEKQVANSGIGGSRQRKHMHPTLANIEEGWRNTCEEDDQSNSEQIEIAMHPIVEKSMYRIEKNKQSWKKNSGEMGTLAKLVYTNTKSFSVILSHPVVQTFLDLKWKKMINYFRLATFLQMSFCILYTVAMYDIYVWTCPHTRKTCQWTQVDFIIVTCLCIANLIFLLKEIFEATYVSKLKSVKIYFEGSENCIQLLFCLINFATTTPIYLQNSFHPLQYGLATFGILLASIVIVMVIGNSNQTYILHSAYVHVYGVIIKRFLTVLSTFSAILISFAISFSVIFSKPIVSFKTFIKRIGKMFMMLAGEFGFDETFSNNNSTNDQGEFDHIDNTKYELVLVAYLLFVLFATFVTIVLIDIFLGYTISDIQELKKSAEKIRRSIQVEQLYIMEGFLENLKTICSCCFSFIDIRVVISKPKGVERDTAGFEMVNNAVIVPFKDLNPQIRMEFRKILNNEELH